MGLVTSNTLSRFRLLNIIIELKMEIIKLHYRNQESKAAVSRLMDIMEKTITKLKKFSNLLTATLEPQFLIY